MVVLVFLVLSCIGNLIASILLIMGTKKVTNFFFKFFSFTKTFFFKQRHPGFVFVWLVASMISIVIFFISCTVDFKIQNIFGAALQIYWWICIYALYQMLKAEKSQPVQVGVTHPGAGETKYVPGPGYAQA